MIRVFSAFLTFCVMLWTATALAAPKAELIPRWQAHNTQSQQIVDHTALDKFLKSYRFMGSDGIARIRYSKVTLADKADLDAYVQMLQQIKVSDLNRPEQFAYWANLYNAGTLKLILDYYPVPSIKDISISPGFFSVGPWGKKWMTVEGEALSLDNIEHGILRPIWQDARVHYVVNCASLGCPDIPEKAIITKDLEGQLNDAAISYINHPRGVRVNSDNSVYLSKIYDWFSEDFGNNDKQLLAHLQSFARPELRAKLAKVTDISGYGYSWDLNGDPLPSN